MNTDTWNTFPNNEIRFIEEQFGNTENELKGKLIALFECKNQIDQPARAYLAKVEYKASRDINIALCIPVVNNGGPSLVNEIAIIFREMFGSHEHLDVIFIGETQERMLRKVCCPFYCVIYFKSPDFYLTSSEGYNLEEVRACYKEKRLMNGHPDGYMLCKIDPPISGQSFNLGDQMINRIIISNRHVGYSIFFIEEWPAYVHVLRLVNNIETKTFLITENMTESIGWAEIFDTQLAAKNSR